MEQGKLKILYSLLKEYQEEYGSLVDVSGILNTVAKDYLEGEMNESADMEEKQNTSLSVEEYDRIAQFIKTHTRMTIWNAEKCLDALIDGYGYLPLNKAVMVSSLFIKGEKKTLLIDAVEKGEIEGQIPEKYDSTVTYYRYGERIEKPRRKNRGTYSFNTKSLLQWLTSHYTLGIEFDPLKRIINNKLQ